MVTLLHWTLICEWYMARVVVENGHEIEICYGGIGLLAHYVI